MPLGEDVKAKTREFAVRWKSFGQVWPLVIIIFGHCRIPSCPPRVYIPSVVLNNAVPKNSGKLERRAGSLCLGFDNNISSHPQHQAILNERCRSGHWQVKQEVGGDDT